MGLHWDFTNKEPLSSVDMDVLVERYQKKIEDLERRLSEREQSTLGMLGLGGFQLQLFFFTGLFEFGADFGWGLV